MDDTAQLLARSSDLYLRAAASDPHGNRPPVYKAIGISLAVSSGVFIGTSFVLKKTGLLKANVKYNEEAGEGYGYLKNAYWWTGMTLMIIGEICNFVAYAFVDAILVTPLGALSVVITTILSAIFLKERLSFVGKVGCFQCIVGSVIIVMNAPAQSSAADIQEMKHFVLAPGFLSYAGVVIVGCAFIAFWAGPRYGKQSMLVYLTVCSLVGGLSVVATQGLGAAVVTQASGKAQFNQWFLYVLFVFVIATLLTEIIFLNKALNLFNAALVTPTYYVYFNRATIVSSAILFQGFKGTPTSIITVVFGFLVICSGVVLLQLSKSAKDVPDAAVFKGDLDQVRTVAEQEEPESEPKADAIRGAAAIVRRISTARQKREVAEAKRVHEERLKDQMEPIGEDEMVEWDGLRRRKTTLDSNHSSGGGTIRRQKTIHPPLGMAHFPDEDPGWNNEESRPASTDVHGGVGLQGRFFSSFRRKNSNAPAHTNSLNSKPVAEGSGPDGLPSQPITTIAAVPSKQDDDDSHEDTAYHGAQSTDGAMELDRFGNRPPFAPPLSPGRIRSQSIMWAEEEANRPRGTSAVSAGSHSPAPTPPPHGAKRQFSFQNPFHRNSKKDQDSVPQKSDSFRPSTAVSNNSYASNMSELPDRPSSSRRAHEPHHKFTFRPYSHSVSKNGKAATEEERLGLVKGDSAYTSQEPNLTESPIQETYSDARSDSEEWELEPKGASAAHNAPEVVPLGVAEKEVAEGPRLGTSSSNTAFGERGQDRDTRQQQQQQQQQQSRSRDPRGGGGVGGGPPAFI